MALLLSFPGFQGNASELFRLRTWKYSCCSFSICFYCLYLQVHISFPQYMCMIPKCNAKTLYILHFKLWTCSGMRAAQVNKQHKIQHDDV